VITETYLDSFQRNIAVHNLFNIVVKKSETAAET